MECKSTKYLLLAFVITLAVSGLALGQDSVALSVAPSALHALDIGGIAEGQKVRVEGIVIDRKDRSFTFRDTKGTAMVVVVTDKTVIKKGRKGWFHRDTSSSADEICCGLRLKVEGQGNRDGQLVAKHITIDERFKTVEDHQTRCRALDHVISVMVPWNVRGITNSQLVPHEYFRQLLWQC